MDKIKPIYFCPKCHQKIEVPAFLRQGNVKGKINLECSHCKKGKVIIDMK